MPTNFEPTSVNPAGLTALIQNLGRDCSPTQFIREFAKNCVEACQRTGLPDRKIVIDFNEEIFHASGFYKLSFIDNGDGMSEQDMLNLLNRLSSSGANANPNLNYGVGAKISALTRNHAGILYNSWKDGIGHAVLIKYDPESGIYGIQGIDHNGRTIFAPKLKDTDKPALISGPHGTRVTLFGMTEDQDTMIPPEGFRGIRESWLVLYLNSRFFTVPNNIEIHARIGYYRDVTNTRHNYLSKIVGQKAVLDEASEASGSMRVTDATAYWWILKEGADGHGRAFVKGHTALVNQDEVFDISDARSNRVTYFGVIYGRDRIVIYIEPDHAVQNTSRTSLVKQDGSPLAWDTWQDDFRDNMPPVLKAFLDDLRDSNSRDSHGNAIRDRLKNLRELFKLSRFRAKKGSELLADPDSSSDYGTTNLLDGDRLDRERSHREGRGRGFGSLATALLSRLVDENESGVEAETVEPDPFPTVQWTTDSESSQLVDRAAEYIPASNLILANSNFAGVSDLVEYFSKSFKDNPEYLVVIREVVLEAFEQVLTECVAGALSLKNRPNWNESDYSTAVSKEALTTAAMQRYWMVSHIKRILGSKIRGFNDMTNQQLQVT